MANATLTAVGKWGNSPAVRIPKAVMEQAGLAEGDEVFFEVEGPGVIVVHAAKDEPTLEALAARITSKNRHAEADWGKPVGNEVW
jgi:antitoxin MazE